MPQMPPVSRRHMLKTLSAGSMLLGGPLARWAARFKLPRVDPS